MTDAERIEKLERENTLLRQALRDRGTHAARCNSQKDATLRRRFWKAEDAQTCNCIIGELLRGVPSKWAKNPDGTSELREGCRSVVRCECGAVAFVERDGTLREHLDPYGADCTAAGLSVAESAGAP